MQGGDEDRSEAEEERRNSARFKRAVGRRTTVRAGEYFINTNQTRSKESSWIFVSKAELLNL